MMGIAVHALTCTESMPLQKRKRNPMTHPIRLAFHLIIAMTALTTIGCGNEQEAKQEPLTLVDFENALTNSGFTFEKTPKLFTLIAATDGAGYVFNGDDIEVYQYDLNNPSGKSMYESIANDGGSFFEKQGITNKSLLLSPNTNHPDWEKILEVFNSL